MAELELVDAQLHAFGPDIPARPWSPDYGRTGRDVRKRAALAAHPVEAEALVSMMDAVGVSAAVLVQPPMYGWDNSYSVDAALARPDRFRVVGLIDPAAADVDSRLAAWNDTGVMVGARLVAIREHDRAALREGRFDGLFKAAERHGVTVFVVAPGQLDAIASIVGRHPGLQFVIDHLGLPQPPLDSADPEPFGALDKLVGLSRFDNVAVKCTGVPSLSREPYPFLDVWPHIHRVLQAFGPERVMWGTDITRMLGLHTYAEAVFYMRHGGELGERDLELVMGGTLRRLLHWPRSG
jgi:predicted TIM-barrel fold metal-dependent hydrolase